MEKEGSRKKGKEKGEGIKSQIKEYKIIYKGKVIRRIWANSFADARKKLAISVTVELDLNKQPEGRRMRA